MGASRTRPLAIAAGRSAGAFAALGFALVATAAGPASAPREPAVKGAPGVVVRFEESPGANLLYLQEKGGMVTSIPPPVPDPRQDRAKADERAIPAPAESPKDAAPAKARPAPPATAARRP